MLLSKDRSFIWCYKYMFVINTLFKKECRLRDPNDYYTSLYR